MGLFCTSSRLADIPAKGALTVSKEALVVLDSSDTIFFPVKTFLRFFLTSLLKITWKKKMEMPCEVKRETFGV